MVMLADLRAASFRGARFLVPKDDAEEGRNTIDHLYPDSNVRYAEDNGYRPPEFKLTCILHGSKLLSQFNALRSALNTPGPGTLHHPWYGTQFCAVKGPWKVKREDRDSGVLELEVCFLVTGPAVFPGRAGAIAALVTGLSASFVTSLFNAFVEAYGAPGLGVTSEDLISDTVQGTAQQFLDAFGSVADVQTAAGHIIDTPERYVRDGASLAAEMTTLFRAPFEDLEQTYSSGDIATALTPIAAAAVQGLSDARAIVTSGPTATFDYQVRADILYTYSTFIALATLSSMAEAMAGTTYTTADGVAAAESQLLALYGAIPLDQIDSDTAAEIAAVVAAAMDVLRQEELQLPNITDLYVVQFPASVLSYMLYDTDAQTDTLVNLNTGENPVLLDGDVNVLIGIA